jgi:hypothetical protein
MHSKSAADVASRRARRMAAMTPGERVQLAGRLGEEGIAGYMTARGVDRQTALKQIKATRRLGRRRSACAEADEH